MDVQTYAKKLVSLGLVIYGAEKTGLMDIVMSQSRGGSTQALEDAAKSAVALTLSNYSAEYLLSSMGWVSRPASLLQDLKGLAVDLFSSGTLLFAFDKFNIDSMFGVDAMTPEKRAVGLTLLFTLVSELNKRILASVF